MIPYPAICIRFGRFGSRKEVQQIKADLAAQEAENIGAAKRWQERRWGKGEKMFIS